MTPLLPVRPGLWHWQAYEPAVKCDLSATAVATDSGVVFIDPIPYAEPLPCDPPVAVLLTSGNHARSADSVRKRFGVPILAAPEAVEELGIAVDGFDLPDGVKAITLPGAARGEVAYLVGNVLCVGDAIINLPGYEFTLLPAKYCEDMSKLRDSVRKLLSLDFEIMTFAHGAPVVANARTRLLQLIT